VYLFNILHTVFW